jgi:hypothetical protein
VTLFYSISSTSGVQDAFITDNAGLSLGGANTLEFWLRPSAISRIHTGPSKWLATGNQRSYRLYVNASNQLVYEYSDDGTTVRTLASSALTGFAIDTWFHLGASMDGDATPEVQFFLNGLPFGSSTAIAGPGTVFDSTADYRIGNFDGGAAADNFRGHMMGVKVWGDLRTAAEMFATYQDHPVDGDGLVAGHIGGPNDLLDLTTNNHDLTDNGLTFVQGEVHGYQAGVLSHGYAGGAEYGGHGPYDVTVVSEGSISAGVIPPTLTVIDPTPVGSRINRFKPVTFKVEDDSGLLAQVLISVSLDDNAPDELLYDGTNFAPLYDKLSTVSAITNGFLFTVLREDGWIAQPTFRAFAVDLGGNVLP